MKKHLAIWKATLALFFVLSAFGLFFNIDASFARSKAEKQLAVYNDLFDQQRLAAEDRSKVLAADLPTIATSEQIIPTPETLVAPATDSQQNTSVQNPTTNKPTTNAPATTVVKKATTAPAKPQSTAVVVKPTSVPAKPKVTAVPVKTAVPPKPKPTRTKAS